MEKGYIKLFRCLQDNELWQQKPFSKGQAWVDLLLLTNYKDGGYWLRGIYIKVLRGQCGWSQVRLAERWGWSRDKVRRYLKHLENESQIKCETIQQNEYLSSLITMVNHDLYQGDDTADNTADDTASRQQTDSRQVSNNKDKKDKKVKKDIYGEFSNVKLTAEEHKKLVAGYGTQKTGEMIERLSVYIQSQGKERKYKSHYATILGWLRSDGVEPFRVCSAKDIMPANSKASWTHPDTAEQTNNETGKKRRRCPHCDSIFGTGPVAL